MNINMMWDCAEQAPSFFPGGDPEKQESFQKRADYLAGRSFERNKLAQILKREHERLGAGQKALDNIALLEKEETLAVVTGQQIGMLTGPLYTLYKGITTIRLAEEQSVLLNRPVVPIFWLAGEDHDWAEIQTSYLLDRDGKTVSIQLPGQGGGVSVGMLPVPEWSEIERQLEPILFPSEFKQETLEALAQFTEKADNLVDWFVLIFQWLLKDKGLIFFNPLLPELKQMASECYIRIINTHHHISKALDDQTRALEDAGYKPQIRLSGNEVNLFHSVPERRAILWDERGYYLRGKEEEIYDIQSLSELLSKYPGQFSPSVVTRPIVQEFLLPTLAYVPGPGELNYWAQLGGVFRVLGYSMPVLYPRLSLTVITAYWRKVMESEDLTLEQIYGGLDKKRQIRLKELDQLNIDARFAQLRSSIKLAYSEIDPLFTLHPQAEEWVGQNQEKIEGQIQYLEKKIWQAHRKQSDGLLKHFSLLEEGLLPNGHHQERVLNSLSFFVRYGFSFIDKVYSMPLLPRFVEQEMAID